MANLHFCPAAVNLTLFSWDLFEPLVRAACESGVFLVLQTLDGGALPQSVGTNHQRGIQVIARLWLWRRFVRVNACGV